MSYKIYPLHLGTFDTIESSNVLFQVNPGIKIRQPILAWLILGGDEPIVVDAGGSGEEWAATYHHALHRPEELTLAEQLRKHGIHQEDVRTVINTHLHWDHCFQNDFFTRAKFLVQKRELQSAVAPIPTQKLFYEVGIPGVTPGWMKTFDRMEVLDGDETLFPGITLLCLPGHSPGLQGILVDTDEGPFLIASDTVAVYENWTGNERMKHIPNGIHWNLEEYFETFKKIERIGATIIPSHDMRVLEQQCYG